MPLWSIAVLALAVSLDGFSAGMMYGIRKIRIPLASVLIVSLCSAVVLFSSMAFGALFVHLLPERAAQWIGAFILIGIGLWAMVQLKLTSKREEQAALQPPVSAEAAGGEQTLVHWEIRQLGLIIRIWRTPSAADMDRSGVITAFEAFLLGIALSLDSLGAGIGAAFIGFPPVVTALFIGASSGLCIAAGVKLGFLVSGFRWIGKLTVLPGIILIIMGLSKLL